MNISCPCCGIHYPLRENSNIAREIQEWQERVKAREHDLTAARTEIAALKTRIAELEAQRRKGEDDERRNAAYTGGQ